MEGRVPYVPQYEKSSSTLNLDNLPACSSISGSSSTSQNPSDQNSMCTSASTFGKSAQERTLSFQERKRQLIENARKRYIDRRGINIVGSS